MGRALVQETLDRWRDGPVLVEFLLLRAGPRILIFLAHRSGARARNITSARRLLPGGYEKRAASRRHVVCSRAAASEPLSRVVGRANRWSRQRCTAGAAQRLRRAGHTPLPARGDHLQFVRFDRRCRFRSCSPHTATHAPCLVAPTTEYQPCRISVLCLARHSRLSRHRRRRVPPAAGRRASLPRHAPEHAMDAARTCMRLRSRRAGARRPTEQRDE